MKGSNEIAKGYPRGSKELLGPLSSKFGPWETFDWFSTKGIDLKTEKDGRVFPTTDRASSITEILETAARKYSVDIKCGSRVTSIALTKNNDEQISSPNLSIEATGSQFIIKFVTSTTAVHDTIKNSKIENNKIENDAEEMNDSDGVRKNKKEISLVCEKVIFATGGSRVGYDMLKGLGHTLVSPLPSLFSFKIAEKTLHELSGVSVQHSRVRLVIPKEFKKGPDKHLARPQSVPLLTQKGALLITHQGLSGPAALRLSAFGAKVMAALAYKFEVEVCWIPDVTPEDLFDHLWREKERHPTRMMSKGFPQVPENILLEPNDVYTGQENYNYENEINSYNEEENIAGSNAADDSAVRGVLTKRLWNFILSRSKIPAETKWSGATKVDINTIVSELLTGRYAVTGRGMYRDEFVTCGGVPLKEVSFETMESKAVPGLHLCGEVLDIDGVTGGYNFQSAWTAGWLAGHSAAVNLLADHKSVKEEEKRVSL
eukprot:CAMPEP_0119034676 /NCGR_PEP_ID=MMETSP1177-20130426/1683_1 /TAXON_ID=2985 /ORGANISM="Ochromonas sp, Strain CCMP1899" /LENGTH=486 /DNA_ID=CAMNT_0006992289 /DNA_START=563 /DNA_END=2023 /DNA_ORIENTATION=+